MKKTKVFLIALGLMALFSEPLFAQVNCIEDFENQAPTTQGATAGNWFTQNATVGFEVSTVAPNTSTVLRGVDGSNGSFIMNSTDYAGDWLTMPNANCQFCFDIRYVATSGSNPPTGVNSLRLQQTSPLINAHFVVNSPIGPNWQRVCVPIELSSGGNLPSNSEGQWAGPSPTDWDALIQNVNSIWFHLDFAGGPNPSENLYLDNFCFEPCPDTCALVVQDTVICDAAGYSYTFSVQNNTGQVVDGIIVNGVFDPNVLLQPNDIYGPITINYPASANPTQYFDIVMLTDDLACCHVQHCFQLYCPCMDLVTDSIVCLPNGDYQYYMTVHNLDPINTATDLLFDVLPPFAQFTPNNIPVNIPPNGTASVDVTIPGPLNPGDKVNFKTILKGMSGDTLLWCCIDTFCVEIPECCPELLDYELECIGDTDGDGFLEYQLNVVTTGGGYFDFYSNCDVPSPSGFPWLSVTSPGGSNIFENDGSCTFFNFTAVAYQADGTFCSEEYFELDFPPCCPELTSYDLVCIGDTDGDGILEYSLNVQTSGQGYIDFTSPCDPPPNNAPWQVTTPGNFSLTFENDLPCSIFTFTALGIRLDGTTCWEEEFELQFPPCETDPALCFCETLEADVAAGFSDAFNCPLGTFTPNALTSPCDNVTWTVNGTTVGSSVGSTPFQYTYPGVGAYNICMRVNRYDATNQIECDEEYCIGIEIVEWCPEPPAYTEAITRIFPNPVTDELNLLLPGRFQNAPFWIRIFDTNGRLLYEEQRSAVEKVNWDASYLPEGIYFLQIEGKEKNRLSQRFVKMN